MKQASSQNPSPTGRVACACLPHVPVALEERDDLNLIGRPLVIASAEPGEIERVHDLSYAAHLAGILGGMPLDAARRICPELLVRPARPEDYREVFRAMLAALGEISPEIEPVDLARSWVATRGLLPAGGREQSLADTMARGLRGATGLDVRLGLAHGKLTSRIITDYLSRRPVMVLPAGKEVAFLGGLAARYLPLAPSSLDRLRALGITRIHQYAGLPRRGILPRFGYPGLRAWQLAHGQDDPAVRPYAEEPLLVAEHSFPEAIANLRSLHHHLAQLSARLAGPLARQYQLAGRLRLSLELEDGRRLEQVRELVEPVAGARALAAHAEALLQTLAPGLPIARLSLAARGLCPTVGRQLALFQHDAERQAGVAQTLERVRARYGPDIVHRGQVLEPASPLHERRGVLMPWPETSAAD